MPDGTSSFLGSIYEASKYIFLAFLGLLTWNGRRLYSKVDKIESEYVPETTYNDTLKTLRTGIDKGFDEVRRDIKGVHQRIDKLMDRK